jgi:hypothetical protein
MRVKHKDTKKEHLNMSMALSHWQKEYYPNKKYLNYEFYDVPDIFDLYEIDETNGKLTYITSDFAHVIFPKVRENSQKFIYKEHDPKYLDEYLMPINISYSGLSFFGRIKKIWNSIPRPKTIYERITNSTISKFTSNIITTVIGGLLILIIWTVYKTKLIELWNSYFG